MAKLQEYTNLHEKENYFDSGIVDKFSTLKDMLQDLEQYAKSEGFIFRGSNEAKYKMYNSAQRHCITNDLFTNTELLNNSENYYINFISNLIAECKNWNNCVVEKLFASSNIHPNNAIAYLSLMQHFDIPSPFLDFTYDPYIALFFAVDNLSINPSNIQIDNYFSLYYTYTERREFESWAAFRKMITSSVEIEYKNLSSCRILTIEHSNPDNQILNNFNIINQKGLFFYNAHPLKPLEEFYSEFAKEIKKIPSANKLNKATLNPKFVFCINIHKSLAPNILEILKSKGITKDFIYPDSYKMKNSVLQNTSVSLNKLKSL